MRELNTTDYNFPDGWGLYTPEEKSMWFERERSFRQAREQNTNFGRAYKQSKEEQDRLDTDEYRYDE